MTYFHVGITIKDEAGMMPICVFCCTIYMPLTKLKQIAWYIKIMYSNIQQFTEIPLYDI
jgi:hypothetical protein